MTAADRPMRRRWTGPFCGCPLGYHELECHVGEPVPSPRPSDGPVRPRYGHCVICLGLLDQEALRARDDRCTPCYRVMVANHRRQLAGGAA